MSSPGQRVSSSEARTALSSARPPPPADPCPSAAVDALIIARAPDSLGGYLPELQLMTGVCASWFDRPTPCFEVNHATRRVTYLHAAAMTHLSDEVIRNAMRDFCHLINLKRKVGDFAQRMIRAQGAGRCLQSFSTCLLSVLERYDHMMMQYEAECRRQMHLLSQPMHPAPPPLDHNVPITLMSLQAHVGPFIKQLTLLGDLVDKLAPNGVAASSPPSAAALLTVLHASLHLHSLLCSPSLSALIFCLFLSALIPYLEYLEAWTSRGILLEREGVEEFMITRVKSSTDDQQDQSNQQPEDPSKASEFTLRLDASSAVLAPSFLVPHAKSILLTGTARAMVVEMKRRARLGRADLSVRRIAEGSHVATKNLFEQFHAGLWSLLGLPAETQPLQAQSKEEAGNKQPKQPSEAPQESYQSEYDEERRHDADDDDHSEASSADISYHGSENEDDDFSSNSPRGASSSSARRPDPLRIEASASSDALMVLPLSTTAAYQQLIPADSSSRPAEYVASESQDLIPSSLASSSHAAMDIFFQTGFDSIHPWLRPLQEKAEFDPSEEQESGDGEKSEGQGNRTEQQAPAAADASETSHSASTSGTTHSPLPPIATPSLLTALGPTSSLSHLPAILQHTPFTAAAQKELVQGEKVEVFEVGNLGYGIAGGEQTKETEEEKEPWERSSPLSTAKSTTAISSFLASFPPTRTAASLQSLTSLLLFHSSFPSPSPPLLTSRCLLAPLQHRAEQAGMEFMESLMTDAGLVGVLKVMRAFFLGSSGVLAQEVCRSLFERLDAYDLGIIGLNACMRGAVTAASSAGSLFDTAPTQSDEDAVQAAWETLGFTLMLIDKDAASSAAASDPEDLKSDSIALDQPQSIVSLDQLHVTCNIPWPLSSIISAASLRQYNRIWRFLLQLRRAEMALQDCALGQASAAPRSQRPDAIRGRDGKTPISSVKLYANTSIVQHTFYLLKAELSHFLRNIIEYVRLKTTNTFWLELLERMDELSGESEMEALRQVHSEYLDRILFQILLTPKLAAAAGAIKRMLGLCLDMRLLYRTVLIDYLEGQAHQYDFDPPVAARANYSDGGLAPELSSMRSRRGSVDARDDDDDAAPSAVSPRASARSATGRRICLPGVSTYEQFRTRLFTTAMEQMTIIRNEFRQNLRFILILLNKIVENGVNTHLLDLLTRLQFNHFYKVDL